MIKKYNPFQESDEFNTALALYHWLQHNWEGQADPLYADFCQLTAPGIFRPAMSQEYFENIDEEAKAIYDELTRDNYSLALGRVLNYKASDE